MAYIVNAELPKGCCSCPFGRCSYYFPLWTPEHKHTKGFYCTLKPSAGVLEMELEDDKKAVWCPLVKVKGGD